MPRRFPCAMTDAQGHRGKPFPAGVFSNIKNVNSICSILEVEPFICNGIGSILVLELFMEDVCLQIGVI